MPVEDFRQEAVGNRQSVDRYEDRRVEFGGKMGNERANDSIAPADPPITTTSRGSVTFPL